MTAAVPPPLGDALALGLFFFVPGFALARAVFPERRWRGPDGLRGALELFVLSFVLSVALTVLVGYVLLAVAPGGFSAAWSSPTLEVALAAIAAVAFAVGGVEGAYARTPARGGPGRGSGEDGAWSVSRELEGLAQRRRALPRGAGAAAQRSELAAEEEALGRRREAEYER